MKFNDACAFLSSLAVFGIRPGTERIRYAAELLGNPQNKYKCVHVAGTNGKGSVTAFISSVLKEAGYNVGTYTSPYVFKVNERIQFNLENISDDDFGLIFDRVKEVNEELKKTEYDSLTEFEAKTLGAFIYFEMKNADYAVIEVGMGGRFDATNIINPEISLIASISYDHTEYLGDTIEKIAYEKAGIIKKGVPVISGACKEANKVIGNTAKENGSLFISPEDFRITDLGRSYNLKYCDFELYDIKPSLFGKYQFSNSAISAIACHYLGADEKNIRKGIEKAYLPGRFERIEKNVIIDGAHNTDGAKALVSNLKQLNYNRLVFVTGMLENHSCDDFFDILKDMADVCIVTKSSFVRATPIDKIYKSAIKYFPKVLKADTVPLALKKAKEICDKNDLILVSGSFYTIGEIFD